MLLYPVLCLCLSMLAVYSAHLPVRCIPHVYKQARNEGRSFLHLPYHEATTPETWKFLSCGHQQQAYLYSEEDKNSLTVLKGVQKIQYGPQNINIHDAIGRIFLLFYRKTNIELIITLNKKLEHLTWFQYREEKNNYNEVQAFKKGLSQVPPPSLHFSPVSEQA